MGSLLVSWKKWCLKSGLKVYTGVSGHRLKLNLDLTRLTIVDTLFNDQLAWNGWCMEKIFFPITLEIFEASSGFLGSAKPNVHYTQWESQTAENAPEKLELQLGEKKKRATWISSRTPVLLHLTRRSSHLALKRTTCHCLIYGPHVSHGIFTAQRPSDKRF